jgi:phasin family protein
MSDTSSAATPPRPARAKPQQAPQAQESQKPQPGPQAPDSLLDFTKAFGDIRMPGVDFQALADTQHKNLEALAQASQLAIDGVRAVAQRQAEIVPRSIEHVSTMFREWAQPDASEDRFAKHVELAKSAFETGIANARELAELVGKTGSDTFTVLSKRVSESLDEVRRVVSR